MVPWWGKHIPRNTDRNCYTFAGLPTNVKVEGATFLSAPDVFHLARTCKKVYSDLVLSTLNPAFRLFKYQLWRAGEEGPIQWYVWEIPVYSSSQTHSSTLQWDWCETALGNWRGQLYILGSTKETEQYRKEDDKKKSGSTTLSFKWSSDVDIGTKYWQGLSGWLVL